MTKTDNALIVKGLRKSFKKLAVLNAITLSVRRGTVLACNFILSLLVQMAW
ncbi:MAG TPA: hypothetical protein VE544_04595 [Nitrososphaeraceae archaeon]|nr:hypothetical protein [Nitrososphaeraceae archaeon]